MTERFETGPEFHEPPDDAADRGRREHAAAFLGRLAVERATRESGRLITPTKLSPEPRSRLAQETFEGSPDRSSSWAGGVRECTLDQPVTVYRIESLNRNELASIEEEVALLPESDRENGRSYKIDDAFEQKLNSLDPRAGLWCTTEHYAEMAVANSEVAIPPDWRRETAFARVYSTELQPKMTVYIGAAKRQTTIADGEGGQVRSMWSGRGYGTQVYLPRDLAENQVRLDWQRIDEA